jgi:hypothetical protein
VQFAKDMSAAPKTRRGNTILVVSNKSDDAVQVFQCRAGRDPVSHHDSDHQRKRYGPEHTLASIANLFSRRQFSADVERCWGGPAVEVWRGLVIVQANARTIYEAGTNRRRGRYAQREWQRRGLRKCPGRLEYLRERRHALPGVLATASEIGIVPEPKPALDIRGLD